MLKRIKHQHIMKAREHLRREMSNPRDEQNELNRIAIERNIRIAKGDAGDWWNENPWLAEAHCDRCNRRIHRGEGCLTLSRYFSDLKVGTLEDPDKISRPPADSPDLVCEDCLRHYASMGETWAVPWSSKEDPKEKLRRKLGKKKD
jgi:hypothetical protein